jgi:hypothetical protein
MIPAHPCAHPDLLSHPGPLLAFALVALLGLAAFRWLNPEEK